MSVDRKRWGRVGIALGATIAMGVAAAPAQADPVPGNVSAQLDDVTIGAAGASRKVRLMVVAATNATDPKGISLCIPKDDSAGSAVAAFVDPKRIRKVTTV